MLARPQDDHQGGAAVILFNTGAGHHVGPHRLYVPLARDWASHGHVVLRFDLGGIGDSVLPPGNEKAYNETEYMVQDAREAIAFIRREAPGRNVIAVGLCSGAWLAFQSARRGLPLDAFVSINAPLYLRESDRQWLSDGRTLGQYQQSLRDPAKWIKALRGRASYSTFTRVVARALARRVAVRVSVAMPETMADGLANDLAIIVRRGIAGLFVFSRGDKGLAYFEQHVPPALLRGSLADLVQHVVVDEAGHAFRPRGAQDQLIRLATDFVNAHVRSAPVPVEEPARVARQAR
jgi:dienelactone hydrolase